MLLMEIPRVKAGTTAKGTKSLDEMDQERLYLATRAKDLLGYSALVGDVTGERSIGVNTGKLTSALQTLDIQVLDTAAVLDYQCAEAARLTLEKASEELSQYVSGWFTAASWTHTELSDYEQPIPEFVIDKAIRIKEALPATKFYIQHLNLPKADPFLVAIAGKEIYYIEAWDEPRFENRAHR